MDVLSYLSELIQTRKAVGISGLGTVFKKKIPGRYDAETHSFIPPSYTLDFTDEIKEEILLADFIGKKRNVSADTANYFITEFSSDTLRRLSNDGTFSFGDLGTLVKSGEQIRFKPAESINYGFDFYGLPAVKEEQEQLPEALAQIEDVVEEIPAAQPEQTEAAATEEPTIESVIADNESSEENPGDEERVTEIDDTVLPAAEEPPVVETEELAAAQPEEPSPVEAEEQNLESVIADNESSEENPGNEEIEEEPVPASAEENKPADTPVNPFAQYKKNEQQLRDEIESLNFYRSKSPYLKSTGPVDEEVIMKLNKITAKEDTAEAAPSTDAFPVYPTQVVEEKTMPLYLKILLSIGILIVMMGVVYVIKPDLFNALTGKTSAPPKKLNTSASRPAVVAPASDDSLTTDSIQKSGASLSPADTLIKTLPPAKPVDTATVYEIIGASMHDQKEADNFIALMKRSGIDAKVVTNMSGKRLKMSIATLKDEKTAKEELDRLSKKLKIPGIYIYRNKQK
ncbi:hypothetical protein SAMN06265348_1099 [Pedobacter westerhofensis]|uniref:CCDC81-like prokaryotic HU domain-containing protein n=1 Tax=Pedobacter westerhofensis TaxID=425512 RepID=A0A521ESC0_9SPHI|nr:hypothetical protein [Pedobacter westerhofensis]SMO86321.1 hypothetical protein SAMN06265348_1099 [Pedobacter westerhofensis]